MIHIKNDINDISNQGAVSDLLEQLNKAASSTWSVSDLSSMLLGENDVADKYFEMGTIEHAEVREIQAEIIFNYSE